ncbi:MAG: hypothetical protein AB1831_03910 [Pseudomonadota bacterium]
MISVSLRAMRRETLAAHTWRSSALAPAPRRPQPALREVLAAGLRWLAVHGHKPGAAS